MYKLIVLTFFRYADLMMSVMSDDCQYLLLAYNYDPEQYAGPPQAISRSILDNMYGKDVEIPLDSSFP